MKRLRLSQRFSVWILLSFSALAFLSYGYQTGITGKTLKNGPGCECHSPTPFPEVNVSINGPDTLTPGELAIYSITISGGPLVRGGTDIAVSDGALDTISSDLRLENEELTHVWPKEPVDGAVTFQFSYTAPNTPGTVSIYANGNSVNYNGANTGDEWNYAPTKTVTITNPPPTSFPLSVNVLNGWNIVSIPGLLPLNQSVNSWWSGKDPAANVFKYQGGYTAVTDAVPGTGYWMKNLGSNIYNTGDEWPSTGIQLVPHDLIPLSAGWNLIGAYDVVTPVAGITTIPPGLITPSTIFGWSGSYQNPSNLMPGYGYWVYSSSSGMLNTTITPNRIVQKEDSKESWGRIVITDALGKNFILYSVKGKYNPDHYLMPPLPPAGLPDVRFASGRRAEDLALGDQVIEMQGMKYPVKLRIENGNIILRDETAKVLNTVLKPGEEVSISSNETNKIIISGGILPSEYSLEQNYPNPFNPSTKIGFKLAEDVLNAKVTIYNALGEEVAELFNGSKQAGSYHVEWNAAGLPSGLYFYQLKTDKYTASKKMTLLK